MQLLLLEWKTETNAWSMRRKLLHPLFNQVSLIYTHFLRFGKLFIFNRGFQVNEVICLKHEWKHEPQGCWFDPSLLLAECQGVPEQDASPCVGDSLSVCECVHEWVNVSQHCEALWIRALYKWGPVTKTYITSRMSAVIFKVTWWSNTWCIINSKMSTTILWQHHWQKMS